MSRFSPTLAARCPGCGRTTLHTVELTRQGKPAVVECECGYGEILGALGPDDISWQPEQGAAA